MQSRTPNVLRSQRTTDALVAAARALFVERGYAGTGTPEIVAAAGLTRGALYHHFEDKRALFRAVVEAESRSVAAEIERAAPAGGGDPIAALVAGGEAYLQAMTEPGRARLLLVEAPVALGPDAAEIDALHAGRTLVDGLREARAAGALQDLPETVLAAVLAAAYDRAALAIADGASKEACAAVMAAVVQGLRR